MPRFVLRVTLKADLLGLGFEQKVQLFAWGRDEDPTALQRAPRVADDDPLIAELRCRVESDGITVERMSLGGEKCDDAFLRRWLTAKGRDVGVATDAIQAHAEWRLKYVPCGRITEEEISGELAAKKAYLQGCDDKGRPLIIFMGSKHTLADRNVDETQRLICYTMDNAGLMSDSSEGGDGKVYCLFDLTGLRMENLDAQGFSAIFDVLEKHYPERLAVLWFLNAPFLFWGVWRLISPFVNEHTRQKIQFVSGRGSNTPLKDLLPLNILPSRYGGLGELVAADDAVQALLDQQEELPSLSPILTEVGDRSPRVGTPVRRVNLRNWLIRWRGSGRFGSRPGSPGRRRANLRIWAGNRWRDIRNNPVARLFGVHVNSWVGFLGPKLNRHKEGYEGQYGARRRRLAELRKSIIRREPTGHIRIMDRRVPVRAIVVRVLIAELLIIVLNRARFAAFSAFGWGQLPLT
ncbi:unnamed protein product [Ostreobium quekettii]|uniref:CRAL-TRIO domain-containing protein n=1 Tax=Ostreobium quekettii TaxID=121088 RepID=A0A8S1IKY0_9CHLO|nr:unnamed protein product [Ostreobium quekettii]|eukprot:evm.model.scf_1058.7 EVM.evm.TU.scf_1058.7   scf_1058:42313-44706(+)